MQLRLYNKITGRETKMSKKSWDLLINKNNFELLDVKENQEVIKKDAPQPIINISKIIKANEVQAINSSPLPTVKGDLDKLFDAIKASAKVEAELDVALKTQPKVEPKAEVEKQPEKEVIFKKAKSKTNKNEKIRAKRKKNK